MVYGIYYIVGALQNDQIYPSHSFSLFLKPEKILYDFAASFKIANERKQGNICDALMLFAEIGILELRTIYECRFPTDLSR